MCLLAAPSRNVSVWLKYAEMEMKNRFVNHARNVWDRAVSLLPRIDQLWYKYIHMEEMLGNVAGARQVSIRGSRGGMWQIQVSRKVRDVACFVKGVLLQCTCPPEEHLAL